MKLRLSIYCILLLMCYNCGCHNPEDDMGHSDNITNDTFKHLSEHWKLSPKDTKQKVLKMLQDDKISDQHIQAMFEKAAKAYGQSVDESKHKTRRMLEDELEN